MADEYGKMDSEGQTAVVKEFTLESGKVLKNVEVRYKTWGTLSAKRDNVGVVCHALTGNADLEAWWGNLLGPDKPLDTSRYFIFCSNVLGGCYGTTGPTSVDPETGKQYKGDFPLVTIRDMVYLQRDVLAQLGIQAPLFVVGGSMGGMQALEFAALEKDRAAKAVISLCSNGRHQPWQIGISECQRQAIYADPKWKKGQYDVDDPPSAGLGVARMMAMLTYRSQPGYWTKFSRSISNVDKQQQTFNVESYLHYQGQAFHKRGFDAATYVALTKAMDTHDVARGRGDYFEVLGNLKMPTLLVSISSDVLYPYSEQLELADYMPNAQHHMIQSDEGHDGFLLEATKVATLMRGFLDLNCRIVEE